MVIFILVWSYLVITFYTCPFFWDLIDSGVLEDPVYFFASFLFCFLINYSIIRWKQNFNNNKDILYRFITFLFKPFIYVLVFFYCEIKRFFVFLKTFKHNKFIKIVFELLSILWKKLDLIWKPIFKKQSYFGYFKTNKSKWWK